ncbi:hypothetical protein Lal_00019885 [Lupinus albus]|nr:hypothetical protein Lal_00019885 [Lupinus albus]
MPLSQKKQKISLLNDIGARHSNPHYLGDGSSGNCPTPMEPGLGMVHHGLGVMQQCLGRVQSDLDMVQNDSGMEQLDLADSVRMKGRMHQTWHRGRLLGQKLALAWRRPRRLGQAWPRPRRLSQKCIKSTPFGQDMTHVGNINQSTCWLGKLSQIRPSLGTCAELIVCGLLWVSLVGLN